MRKTPPPGSRTRARARSPARKPSRRAIAAPTTGHAYTEYVASEYYDGWHKDKQSEAALVRAANGPEPSWEIYARLLDVYIARNDYRDAQALMDRAVARFEDSPVLLPKRIHLLRLEGRASDAQALMPEMQELRHRRAHRCLQERGGVGKGERALREQFAAPFHEVVGVRDVTFRVNGRYNRGCRASRARAQQIFCQVRRASSSIVSSLNGASRIYPSDPLSCFNKTFCLTK